MSAYVLSVVGTVLLCAILTAILPSGKTNAVIKGVARLLCVLAIISPVCRFIISGKWDSGKNFFWKDFSGNVIQADESFIQYYRTLRIEEAETLLEEELFNRYGTKAEVTIGWAMEETAYADRYVDEQIKITEIHVKNQEKQAEEVERQMWEYLTKNYCSEVLIE